LLATVDQGDDSGAERKQFLQEGEMDRPPVKGRQGMTTAQSTSAHPGKITAAAGRKRL
jgi:hypothetical protein